MLWLTWYYRHEQRMTAEVVSGRAGIHPERFLMIESGKILPTDRELRRIAQVIGWGAAPETMLGPVPDSYLKDLP